MKNNEPMIRLGRRAFLQHGTLLLTAAALDSAPLFADEQKLLRVGLVTDLHHADKPPAGSRHYRESMKKLIEAGEHFQQSKADFIVELGDDGRLWSREQRLLAHGDCHERQHQHQGLPQTESPRVGSQAISRHHGEHDNSQTTHHAAHRRCGLNGDFGITMLRP